MDLDTYIDKKLQEFLEGRDKLSEDDLKKIFDDIVSDEDLEEFDKKQILKTLKELSKEYITTEYSVSSSIRRNNKKNIYRKNKFVEEDYLEKVQKIEYLKSLPIYRQKSKGWFEQREKCISATSFAGAINEDKYNPATKLFFEKIGLVPPSFEQNRNTHHGNKHEEITNLAYGLTENVHVNEYGLIPSPKYKFLSASPDGIVDTHNFDQTRLTKLVGRMVEIKNPYPDGGREIITEGEIDDEICPHNYYCQVQAQLEVCNFDKCDFVQTKIEEYSTKELFDNDCHSDKYYLSSKNNNYRGMLIQLVPKNKINEENYHYHARYIYPPRLDMNKEEYNNWLLESISKYRDIIDIQEEENTKKSVGESSEIIRGSDYIFDKIIYWRINQYHCVTIERNKEWLQEKIKIIAQFWDYVCFYKNNLNEKTKLNKFMETNNYDHTDKNPKVIADIFKYIHTQYKNINPTTKYNPLFQSPSKYCIPYSPKNYKSNNVSSKINYNYYANKSK